MTQSPITARIRKLGKFLIYLLWAAVCFFTPMLIIRDCSIRNKTRLSETHHSPNSSLLIHDNKIEGRADAVGVDVVAHAQQPMISATEMEPKAVPNDLMRRFQPTNPIAGDVTFQPLHSEYSIWITNQSTINIHLLGSLDTGSPNDDPAVYIHTLDGRKWKAKWEEVK